MLLYLQGAGLTGPATDAAGFSKITNEDYRCLRAGLVEGMAQLHLNYGLRWEAQIFPEPVVPPAKHRLRHILERSAIPVRRHVAGSEEPVSAAGWDLRGTFRKKASQCYARAAGILLRAAEHVVAGRFDHDQWRAAADNLSEHMPIIASGVPGPVWPGVVTPPSTVDSLHRRWNHESIPVLLRRARIQSRLREPAHLHDQRRLRTGVGELIGRSISTSLIRKGVHLTRFLNVNRNNFFAPFLGETMVTSSVGKSDYDGFTVGMRKRFSRRYQFEWNYTYAKDKDDDSNERDPFTDRAFDINNLQLDYALSDRDIRHKFNLLYVYRDGLGV